jgi:hypothetical protein
MAAHCPIRTRTGGKQSEAHSGSPSVVTAAPCDSQGYPNNATGSAFLLGKSGSTWPTSSPIKGVSSDGVPGDEFGTTGLVTISKHAFVIASPYAPGRVQRERLLLRRLVLGRLVALLVATTVHERKTEMPDDTTTLAPKVRDLEERVRTLELIVRGSVARPAVNPNSLLDRVTALERNPRK